ncbi:NDP-sugar synthase [Lujinxingia vulgaris]|uniref:NDP-sugar synthase n=1 Tax=Lujinxingia vulgaris TaxID=2600176 RepID=A0A5C6XFP4_9DELT|nr:NDP-sugar synthase [Lujinxingia vulgaris]TXD37687.1 NDP-sugar synthase [Lujinxingia vulgaris]
MSEHDSTTSADEGQGPVPVGGVLCAGYGSRLAPLTDVLPKPLMPFLNTPMVAYALNHLVGAGVEQVGINLHHLPDAIPPVVDRLCGNFRIRPRYVREWEILGTAGGVRGIWQGLEEPETTLIVLNGDSIMNIDLAAQLRAHRQSGALASMVVRPRASDQPGRVWLNEAGELRGLRDARHPEAEHESLSEFDFTGVHFLEPELLRHIPLEEGCMVGDVYIPMLERGERINALINDDFWAALDNPRLFFETTRRVLREPGLFAQAPLPEALGKSLYIYNQDTIDPKAQLAGPMLSGLHASIASGARVGPEVVLDGVEVTGGTRISQSILYGMGRLEGEWERVMAVAGKVVSFSLDD